MTKAENNILEFFKKAANEHPTKVAIIEKAKTISFSTLENEVHYTAIYFQQKGIKKGDKVLVFVPMSIDLYRILLALFKIGAIPIFLDEWVSKKRMEAACELANASAFIGIIKARVYSLFSTVLKKIPIKIGTTYKKYSSKNFDEVFVQPNDTALITFTTGSTGTPKAAIRTHEILTAQFEALKEIINPSENDIDLCALPIVLLINLGAGYTSVIANYNSRKPNTLKVKRIVEQVKKYKVNRIVGSPFLLHQLALYCLEKNIKISLVQKIFTGGATVFKTAALNIRSAFFTSNIQVVYGSTEAEPISAIDIDDLIKSNNTVKQNGINTGIPHSCAKIKICKISEYPLYFIDDAALNEHCLAENNIGEIIVSGKHVVQQYLHNEDAVKQTKIFIGDTCWHRTGDSGYLTKEGNLFFTGRCNTLIYKNNTIISTYFYENNLQAIVGINIGTVLQKNETLIAFVETDSTCDKKFIEKEIYLLQIDRIVFLKKIPRDPRHNSKIDYEKLRTFIVGY